MELIEVASKVIGGYVAEYQQVGTKNDVFTVVGDREFDYFPLLNNTHLTSSAEWVFVNPTDLSMNFRSYNERVIGNQLANEVRHRETVNVSDNDFTIEGKTILLNLTGEPLTVVTGGNIKKTFAPIMNHRLTQYKGSIVILETTSLNSDRMIRKHIGMSSYLKVLADSLRDHGGKTAKNKKAIEIYEEGDRLTQEVLKRFGFTEPTNSLKIVSALVLKPTHIRNLNNGRDLLIKEYGYLISRKSIVDVVDNPIADKDIFRLTGLSETINKGAILYYINDPDNEFEDRYIGVFGKACKVPKIRDPSIPEGFFLTFPDHLGTTKLKQIHLTLDQIEGCTFLFKTVESAIASMSDESLSSIKMSTMKQETEELKLEAAREKQKFDKEIYELKKQAERESHDLKREADERKAEADRRKLEADELKRQYEKELREIQDAESKRERDYEERKRQLEIEAQESKRLHDKEKQAFEDLKTQVEFQEQERKRQWQYENDRRKRDWEEEDRIHADRRREEERAYNERRKAEEERREKEEHDRTMAREKHRARVEEKKSIGEMFMGALKIVGSVLAFGMSLFALLRK